MANDGQKNPEWLAGVEKPAEWETGLTGSDTWAHGLNRPWDDVPKFDTQADPEVNEQLRLKGDRSYRTQPARRLFRDYRSNPDAYLHLDPLPADGETLHGVISGKYALFEMIPALIEHAGPIDELHIATLSFNRTNAVDLLEMFDASQIKTIGLLISYYFKSTSREIYDQLVPHLRDRGQKVLAMRTHCKLLLAKMASGERFTVETSANLRSSVNIEQFCLTRDAGLYDFHRGWMVHELLHGEELSDPNAKR